jgi:hypothetical protein
LKNDFRILKSENLKINSKVITPELIIYSPNPHQGGGELRKDFRILKSENLKIDSKVITPELIIYSPHDFRILKSENRKSILRL